MSSGIYALGIVFPFLALPPPPHHTNTPFFVSWSPSPASFFIYGWMDVVGRMIPRASREPGLVPSHGGVVGSEAPSQTAPEPEANTIAAVPNQQTSSITCFIQWYLDGVRQSWCAFSASRLLLTLPFFSLNRVTLLFSFLKSHVIRSL